MLAELVDRFWMTYPLHSRRRQFQDVVIVVVVIVDG